jgi:hypothetical protein
VGRWSSLSGSSLNGDPHSVGRVSSLSVSSLSGDPHSFGALVLSLWGCVCLLEDPAGQPTGLKVYP